MEIELNIKTDIYSHKNPKKPVLIKRNQIAKISTYTEDILLVKQIFTNKGEVDKSYCSLTIKDLGEIVVNHSYDYVRSIRDSKTQIGFNYKNKTLR